MDAIQAIKTRKSIRKYKKLPIPKEILEDIVDCGRLAPTGYNQQPWIFIVITDQYIRRRISEAATYGKFIDKAGACIAVFCREGAITMLEDACAATENMIIAANSYNIGTCWVNSYKKSHSNEVKKILDCPPDFELMTLLSVGYPEEQKTTEKKTLDMVLRWEKF